jgi:putative transposase
LCAADQGFPDAIAAAWHRPWPEAIAFLAFPAEPRRIILTTQGSRRRTPSGPARREPAGQFPLHDAALTLLLLVLNRAGREWRMPLREWHVVRAQVAMLFHDRPPHDHRGPARDA